MEISLETLKRVVEAALLMSREPQTAQQLAALFTEEEQVAPLAIVDVCKILMQEYQNRGVELVEVASGYRFQVCLDLAPWISRTMAEKPQRYSRAVLETLALIAYRQPITRAEIEEIRGVAVSTQIMRTLEEREWIRVIGHRDVPGRPGLYATTKQFLDDFNLKSLGELPTLAELRDLDQIAKQLDLGLAPQEENTSIEEGTTPAEQSETQNEQAVSTETSEVAEELENNEAAEELEKHEAAEELENNEAAEELENHEAAEELENNEAAEEFENNEAAEGLENYEVAEEFENHEAAEELENNEAVEELQIIEEAEEWESIEESGQAESIEIIEDADINEDEVEPISSKVYDIAEEELETHE